MNEWKLGGAAEAGESEILAAEAHSAGRAFSFYGEVWGTFSVLAVLWN